MHHSRKSPEQRTAQQLAARLEQAAIPHAITGSVAVELHGGRSIQPRVQVILNRQGLQSFHQDFAGSAYHDVPGKPRRFVDCETNVPVNIQISGHYPGYKSPGPFSFPDPNEAYQQIDRMRVVTLPWLVQLSLASGRSHEMADVVSLIQSGNLDESFLDRLHPAVHRSFLECLEEKRRDDEFESQQ